MNERALGEALEFAVGAAQAAGTLTLGYSRRELSYETKADRSPVTVADRAAEALLREQIEGKYPEHGILGEEYGEKETGGGGRWILDPIDGTISFISGVPLYAVLVGLEWEGEMVVGVIHLPALGETVYAGKGLGCWSNGRRARVSAVGSLSAARIALTSTKTLAAHAHGPAFERLRSACYTDRGWSDAYAYALLATGRVEIALDPIMNIWDTAALLPVVKEAGGTFTDWQGNTTHTAPECLATNGYVFDEAMRALRA